jgi:heme exporter protein CcmD
MSTTAYIATAWIATFLSVAAYAAMVVRRGRRLSRQVPPEERRWLG